MRNINTHAHTCDNCILRNICTHTRAQRNIPHACVDTPHRSIHMSTKTETNVHSTYSCMHRITCTSTHRHIHAAQAGPRIILTLSWLAMTVFNFLAPALMPLNLLLNWDQSPVYPAMTAAPYTALRCPEQIPKICLRSLTTCGHKVLLTPPRFFLPLPILRTVGTVRDVYVRWWELFETLL